MKATLRLDTVPQLRSDFHMLGYFDTPNHLSLSILLTPRKWHFAARQISQRTASTTERWVYAARRR